MAQVVNLGSYWVNGSICVCSCESCLFTIHCFLYKCIFETLNWNLEECQNVLYIEYVFHCCLDCHKCSAHISMIIRMTVQLNASFDIIVPWTLYLWHLRTKSVVIQRRITISTCVCKQIFVCPETGVYVVSSFICVPFGLTSAPHRTFCIDHVCLPNLIPTLMVTLGSLFPCGELRSWSALVSTIRQLSIHVLCGLVCACSHP